MAQVEKSTVAQPCAAEQLSYLGSMLDVDPSSLIKRIYSDAFLDRNSLVASHVTNMVMETVKKDIARNARNARHAVSIPQVLTNDEKDAFRKMYPEYNVYFADNTLESHNFAHASRIIETLMCMNKLGYFVNCKIRDKRILIKDIGGNRVFHGLRGHISVHVCAPGLGMVDAGRRSTASWRLDTAVVDKKDFYKRTSLELMRQVGSHYCNNKAQECEVQAPAAIFIHSIYDMTTTDVANAMTAAGATMAAGTFIYDPRILMYTTGTIPLLNVMWNKYRTKTGIELIDFTFINDAQPVYTHSWKNYLSYLETTYITDTEKKNHYLFQFNENRNGIQFFSIIRIDQCHIPRSTIKINHSLHVKRDFLMVTYYEWVERVCFSKRSRMRKIKLLVPTILWEQAYDMLKQQADGSFTVAKAQEFVICYNKKTIVNGQTVSHHQKCSSNVLDKIAYALYVRVYIDKYLATSALTAVLDDVTKVRELTKAGPLKALYLIIKEKMTNWMFPGLDTNSFIAPYCAWAALSKLYRYPVDVVDAVMVRPVEHDIPEILQLYRRNADFGDIESLLTGEENVDITPNDSEDYNDSVSTTAMTMGNDDSLLDGPLGAMPQECTEIDGQVHAVRGDGHCFFHSVAYLMVHHGYEAVKPADMRHAVVEALGSEPEMFAKDLCAAISTDMVMQLVGGDGAEPVCAMVCKAVAIYYEFNLCIHFHENDVLVSTEKYVFSSDYLTYHFHFNRMTGGSVGHFQPITYPTKKTEDNTGYENVLYEYASNSVNNIKQTMSRIDEYTEEQYENARLRCNPLDPQDHGYVCRSALKVIPILDKYGIDVSGHCVVDLCSAPGSVSQLMVQRGARRVIATSLPETKGGLPLLYRDPRVCQSFIDMCDLEELANFSLGLRGEKYHLVVGDGATIEGNGQGYLNNRTLYISEIFCALSVLSNGGNFILKSWWIGYAEQVHLLMMLRRLFVKIVCHRDYPVRVSSTEFYLVCLNYKGLDTVDSSVLQHLTTMMFGSYANESCVDNTAERVNELIITGLGTLLTCLENPGINYATIDQSTSYTALYLKHGNSECDSATDDRFGILNKDAVIDTVSDERKILRNDEKSKKVMRKSKSKKKSTVRWSGGGDYYDGPIKTAAIVQALEVVLSKYMPEENRTVLRCLVADEVLMMIEDSCNEANKWYHRLNIEKMVTLCQITYSKLTTKVAQSFAMQYRFKHLTPVDGGYVVNCDKCKIVTYVPAIDGWYACRCDCRTALYAIAVGVAVKLDVVSFMVTGMMRDGVPVSATMDRQRMHDEMKRHRSITQITDNYDEVRHRLLVSEKETADAFMGAIASNVAQLFTTTTIEKVDEPAELTVDKPIPMHDKPVGEAMLSYVRPIIKPNITAVDEIYNDGSVTTRLKKAFLECYRIWELTDHYHTVSLRDLLNVASHAKLGRELNEYLDKQEGEPLIRSDGKWYPREPKGDYMYAYNGIDYEEFSMHGDGMVIVSEYTRKKFEPTFMRKCRPFLETVAEYDIKTEFDLVSGVPGCGKTTYIMDKHRMGDLVLSATREGAVEFRERAAKKGMTELKKHYKTVYSYLYNEHTHHEVVYVDEAMMMHPGMMYAICRASRCKKLVMVGDVKQIPYYVRIDYDATYHKFTSVFEVSTALTTSYRCPKDVARYMSKHYDKFVSASNVVSSMQVRYVTGKNDVPTGYDIYLTFSQSDKEQLLTIYDNVNTIHEYQGKQARRVCLYRGTPTPIKLYESVEHHIVALTRHTNHLVYCTVLQDTLYNAIQTTIMGGMACGVSISYVATSLFASNKYSVCHTISLDKRMSAGIAVDFKQRFGKYPMHPFGKGLGMVYFQFDTENKRYIYNLVTKLKYYEKPTVKSIEKALITLNLLLAEHGVPSIHMPAIGCGLDGLSWYDVERVIGETITIPVVVHDPKSGLDKYHLADVILDYHRVQTGPSDIDVKETDVYDLEKPIKMIVDMPSAYVLVYNQSDDYEVSLQCKYHKVPIALYHDQNARVIGSKRYRYACVLTNKSDKTKYKIPKYYSEALMMRSYRTRELDGAVDTLQQFNDAMLPNAYGIDTSLDVLLVANSDITCFLQNCSFDQSRVHSPIKQFDCVKPVLRTAMCPPRPSSSLKEVMKAIEKRNCAVPRIQVTMDIYAKAAELYGKTLKYVYDDVPRFDEITLNADEVADWLTTQDNKISTIIEKTSITDMALSKYSLTIKKNSKPLLDMSCVNTYAALQTVVFSKKDFNTYFCPIFRAMKRNMVKSMVSKVTMFSDVPPKQFAERLRARMTRYDLSQYYSLEFDVSKYDKSQALLHLLVDCMLMRHFGVSDVDVNRWFIGHSLTYLHDPSTGFAAYNYFQRKSGDPSTWILNTQQVLVMIVNVLDMQQWESVIMIAASGDDSEILSMDRLRVNEKRFADVFNYEVKVYDTNTSIYFCSKFMIIDEGDVYLIPDLYKMIKKLGRHDLKNREHLVSYRRSVLDGLKDFIVPTSVKEGYVRSLSERYKAPYFSYDSIVDALFNLALTDDDFERLYRKNVNYYAIGYGAAGDI